MFRNRQRLLNLVNHYWNWPGSTVEKLIAGKPPGYGSFFKSITDSFQILANRAESI